MKKYTCTKRCNFGGKQFFAGDEIPGELIEPSREKALLKYGLFNISEVPNDSTPPKTPDKPEDAAKAPKDKKTGKSGKAPENPSEAPTIGDDGEQQPDTETEKPGEKAQE